MIALLLLWGLITAVSLAIALVIGWITSPRTTGILYIIVSLAFAASCISNVLEGVTRLQDSWFAFMICFTFFYIGCRLIAEFPEYK